MVAASQPNKTAILAIVMISYLMIVLDTSVVITGLPRIKDSLGFSPANLSWVQTAYTLAFGGLLLLGARVGDLMGRRRMFIIGMVIFTTASMAIGLAQSAAWMVAARAVQGAGSAILAPSTLALLTTSFAEGRERTRAVGLYGTTAGIGASVGLVLGGILADWLSWRVGFFINLPIGLAMIWGARRYFHETERHSGQFDLLGAVASTLGMTALVYGLVRAAHVGWKDGQALSALGAGVVLIALLLINEAFAKQPIMPLRLFNSRERAGAYAARLLFLGAMVGFFFFLTQYLQGVLGLRPSQAGMAFLPTTLPQFLAGLLVSRLSHRFGNGPVLSVGLLLTMLGMAGLSLVTDHSSYAIGVALPLVVIGIGQGFTLSPLTVAGIAGVRGQDAGAASGLVNAAHQLGGSLGLAVLVVVFSSAAPVHLEGKTLLAHRIAAAFTGSTIMLAMALAATLLLIVHRPKTAVCAALPQEA
ncbi:MAG TPA: MFS transporter [Candidatus Sulfotelmatobacter sp.]|nr:MFS transporter [Candidatus Sulfotelmatobacter sp.]